MKKTTCFFIALVLFLGCSGKTRVVNIANLPDSYQCEYMQEICREASDFEHRFSAMSSDEQAEAKTILGAYQYQCEAAIEACKQSAK
ncbi:hypothetical protein CHISP_0983 [Chitinispirillum alkaliphilum]|nr:hypothetical protein CHISP_0983 [Chitinispirillum alkaliphilum]